jgi:hypothetical protein
MTLEIKIFFGAIAYIGAIAICFYRAAHPRERQNERAVLRRCRAELWAMRRELEALPATRAVHQLHEQCDRMEEKIDSQEARVCR